MFEMRFATEEDVPVILDFIRDFAEYEDSLDQVSADEGSLRKYFIVRVYFFNLHRFLNRICCLRSLQD